jgi:hypothetical protein
MRPGAGQLPDLAPGRPRGASTSGPRVTLLQRAPRRVYRVYREEEFLAAEDRLREAALEDWPDPPAAGPSARGRVLGLAAMAGVLAAAAGVAAMLELRSTATTRIALGPGGRGHSPQPAPGAPRAWRPIARDMRRHGRERRVSQVHRRALAHGGARAVAQTSIPAVPAAADTRSQPDAHRYETDAAGAAATAGVPPATVPAAAPATAGVVPATVSAAAPATAGVPPATLPAAAPARASAATAAGAPARPARPEFGFER